jgi:LPXTG-site transpeptidase (sortase) family protein
MMIRLKFLRVVALTISVIVTILAGFIIVHRYFPAIVNTVGIEGEVEGITNQLPKETPTVVVVEAQSQIPQDNRIVISKIAVDAPIVEGIDESALLNGMWRRPNSSTPDKGGNTVITGHRFLYTTGPNTFFNLDKITVDDIIAVYWEGKEYDYMVYEITIVNPDRIDIEENTNESILTLYTCTPLWTSKTRLVIKAILQLPNPNLH